MSALRRFGREVIEDVGGWEGLRRELGFWAFIVGGTGLVVLAFWVLARLGAFH